MAFIILAQCLEILFNSFRNAETANVFKDALLLRDIQSQAGPGVRTVASSLLGGRRGSVVEAWCMACFRWIVLATVLANAAEMGIGPAGIPEAISGFFFFALAACSIPCLQLKILKDLLVVPEVHYYICTTFAVSIGTFLIFWSRSPTRVWTLSVNSAGFIILFSLVPLVDALPLKMRSFLGRKALPLCCAFLIAQVVLTKLETAEIYSNTDIFELGVPGLATLSVFQLRVQGSLILSSMLLLFTERAWWRPEEALMLSNMPRLEDLLKR